MRRPSGGRRRVCVLTVAASDSGGGAGIQADLLAFAAHGLHGACAITAVTAQDSRRILDAEPVSRRLVERQLDAVFQDFRPAAVKIGALFDRSRVEAVAAALSRWRARNVVLDPVVTASSGGQLLSPRAMPALRRDLLPLCSLVTPNLDEAGILTGQRLRSEGHVREAAVRLVGWGAGAALIKGGHARGRVVSDLLFDGRSFRIYRHPRVATRATHGTGCTLSSAIAAQLALGRALPSAVERAIAYLDAGLRQGSFPGRGRGVPEHFPVRIRL